MNQAHEPGQHSDIGWLHRLISLSDGVFAIALTLLALEIHTPKGWDARAATLWATSWPTFLAYAVSFAAIGLYWIGHRRSFSRFSRADGVLTGLNLLMLALLALLPPATQMLYETGAKGDSMVIYAALLASVGVVHGLMWAYASLIAGLLTEPLPLAYRVWVALMHGLLPGLMCALGLYVGVTHSLSVFALLFILPAAAGVVRRRLMKAPAEPAARPRRRKAAEHG